MKSHLRSLAAAAWIAASVSAQTVPPPTAGQNPTGTLTLRNTDHFSQAPLAPNTSGGLLAQATLPSSNSGTLNLTPAANPPAAPNAAAAAAANAAALATEDPTAPIAKRDTGGFLRRHEGFLKRAKEGPVGLLFLGDSITDGWNRQPHIWEHYYGRFAPANFGIGGDRTQHVIWRIENGELEGIHPRVTVLMLGTNNSGDNTAEQIFAANRKIIDTVRQKIPQGKVLVLAIFPRGPRKTAAGAPEPWEQRMAIIQDVNDRLAKLDDGKNVRFLDIGARFLADDGRIPSIIMPDQLHPNGAGYQLWAEAMQPLLEEMMGKEAAGPK